MNPIKHLKSHPVQNLEMIALYAAAIFVFSSAHGALIPKTVSPWSSAFHLIEYAGFGVLVYPLVGSWKKPVLSALFLCALYAASDEIHQHFVPGRVCDLADFIVDLAGSATGIYLSKKVGGI
jgi:VanZ family protein